MEYLHCTDENLLMRAKADVAVGKRTGVVAVAGLVSGRCPAQWGRAAYCPKL